MILTGITYSRYNYTFKSPITTAKKVLKNREGIILKLIADEKYVSFGESSPLPEFSSEDINQAEKSIKKAEDLLVGSEIPNNFEETNNLLNHIPLTPAARFALEQALFELLLPLKPTERMGNSFADIPVNSLLNFSTVDETLNKVKDTLEKGYSTVKFKAGINPFSEELNLLKTIHERYPEIKIRIDINGAWEKETAVKNINQLSHLNIEFIEQPVENIDDLIYVSEKTRIPIAADESIRSLEDALRVINSGSIKYLVIKPMLLGGYFKSLEILDAAKGKCSVVFSSSLETNLGRRFLVYIASQVNNTIAHGLSTSNLYLEDPVNDLFPVKNGIINYSKGNYLEQLN